MYQTSRNLFQRGAASRPAEGPRGCWCLRPGPLGLLSPVPRFTHLQRGLRGGEVRGQGRGARKWLQSHWLMPKPVPGHSAPPPPALASKAAVLLGGRHVPFQTLVPPPRTTPPPPAPPSTFSPAGRGCEVLPCWQTPFGNHRPLARRSGPAEGCSDGFPEQAPGGGRGPGALMAAAGSGVHSPLSGRG